MMSDLIDFNIDRPAAYEQISVLIKEATDVFELQKKNLEFLQTFDQLILPIERVEERLHNSWGMLEHLQSVDNKTEFREKHQETMDLLTKFSTQYSLDKSLMNIYAKAANISNLNEDQQLLVQLALENFKLAGVDLDPQKKERLFTINQELSQLSDKFGNQLLDATECWSRKVTEQQLAGLSDQERAYLKQLALQSGDQEGYLINLSTPCYQMIMTNCKDRALREELYKAYAHRASHYADVGAQYDNAPLAKNILALRKEEANILNYPTFRDYVLQKRFASSSQEVHNFLNQLVNSIRPQAQQDLKRLEEFAQKDNLQRLEPWDVTYYAEQFKKNRLSIDQEEIRQYFCLDKVLPVMLQTFGDMYGFTTQRAEKLGWHEDVFVLNLIDSKTNKEIGSVYFDLFARPGKRQGAWMNGAIHRADYEDWKQSPVAYIVCNFRKDEPVTLSFYDVETLFHEFGHSLHHLLTERTFPSIAGISQVPWDIVELPSQLNEQWCFEKDFLKMISAHVKTQEPLPDRHIDNLIASRQFLASMGLIRQLELATFDWSIHGEEIIDDVVAYYHQLRKSIAVTGIIPTHAMPLSFSHVFDGGYGAGYYSYLWADAYVYQVYDKLKTFKNPQEGGAAFKAHFLALGPSRELKESLHEFLGEGQSIIPLLRAYGLA